MVNVVNDGGTVKLFRLAGVQSRNSLYYPDLGVTSTERIVQSVWRVVAFDRRDARPVKINVVDVKKYRQKYQFLLDEVIIRNILPESVNLGSPQYVKRKGHLPHTFSQFLCTNFRVD